MMMGAMTMMGGQWGAWGRRMGGMGGGMTTMEGTGGTTMGGTTMGGTTTMGDPNPTLGREGFKQRRRQADPFIQPPPAGC